MLSLAGVLGSDLARASPRQDRQAESAAPQARSYPRQGTKQDPKAKPQPFRYFSRFGDQVLGRCDLIVRGRVESVHPAPRAELVKIEVQEVFKDAASRTVAASVARKEATVLANPGEFFAGSEFLLFLGRFGLGPRYTCQHLLSPSDPLFEVKEAHLRDQLRLESVTDEHDRRDLARQMLLDNARSPLSWARQNALLEIAYVRDAYPELLGPVEEAELRAIARSGEDPTFRKRLEQLLEGRKEGSGR